MSTTQFKSWTPQIRYKANLEMDLRTVTLNQTGQLWYDIYFCCISHGGFKATKAETSPKQIDAKLFWNGRSKVVRLPKEFRFEGDRVRVSRVGAGVLIEPLPPENESPEEMFARIDAIRGDLLFPEGRKQNLAPIREYFE
jgi:antitoxin VapB